MEQAEKLILQRCQLYRVTEWKDQSVYKTEYVCDIWTDKMSSPPPGYKFAPMPSSYEGGTIGTLRPV